MIANQEQTPQRMPGGLPWLGHSLSFRKNPVAFLKGGYERFGETFMFKMAGSEIIALLGPEAHEAFFRGDLEKSLSARNHRLR